MKLEAKEKFKKYLCPPGAGVFTVNTAKEKKETLWKILYNTTEDVNNIWQKSISTLNEEDSTILFGICSDAGGGIQRGANWGPLFLRENLLLNHKELKYFDIGDIRVIPHLLHDKYLNEETISNCKMALYNDDKIDLPVSPLSITEDFCDEIFKTYPEKRLFAIGGDHSVSYPLVKSYLKNKKVQNKKVGLIHFDAHTDLLISRLGIDLCFGSWVSHVLEFMDTKNCYQFGIRSSGKDKKHWEDTFGINQYWTSEIKSMGPHKLAQRCAEELKRNGVTELYVSFDIDALDESIASATGTPEPDGLLPHDCIIILQTLKEHFKITGADLVEIAPNVGNDKLGMQKTLDASGVIASFLIEALGDANH